MKRIFRIVTALAALILTADSYAQNFTNRGREFWVGYGHHQSMEGPCDSGRRGSNAQDMVLYLSAEQAATVTISIDSSNVGILPVWSRTYTIPANTVVQTENIPKGATASGPPSNTDPRYDATLWSLPAPLSFGGEQVFRRRGIHIVSDVPIVAYAHIHDVTNSGATMLLPVETWGYSYTSINSQQSGGVQGTYSWMYIVAKENNTRVRITPSANSRNGKPAGVPFTVDLQKGWIYQYVGEANCQTGLGPELTGTKVKSIVGPDGICHPVAVFSGSGRTEGEAALCGGAGRDNDMQQGFPEHVWGKRYLTAPFSRSSGSTLQANQFQTSVYKIILKDAGTTVKRNGIPLTITGNVYKYSSNTADYIEADKPIMVAQFMAGSGTTCNPGSGDPEMVYISPIEQAINSIGFFRNNWRAIQANYLTLIVPTAGLPSLRIDNSQIFNHTYSHPQNPVNGINYTVVVKGWAASQDQCIVRCDSSFTAITYGLGGAESYGYNAGTYLKNLNAVSEIYNKPDTSGLAQPFTCTGTPMEITALVAYKSISMNWRLSTLSAVMSPSADVFLANPVPIDSVTIGGAKYYRYKLPGTYVFNTAGSYDLPIVCTSTDVDNCSLSETLQIRIEVKGRPTSDFTFTHSGCRTDSVQFNGPNTTGTYTANQWDWNFGDATIDSVKNPKKAYGATGIYNVSLVVTSTEGCLSDTTTKPITISPARSASIFVAAPDTCQGATLTFSDTTTVTAGTFYWDFGTGTPRTLTSNTPQTFTYANPGTYIVKHVIFPTGNCVSDTVYRTVTIYAKPVKPVVTRPINYCQNGTAAPLSATALAGNTLTWYSVYPLTGGSATPITPSTATAGTFNYYVVQTTPQGCVSDTAIIPVIVSPVIAGNTIAADQTVCSGSPAAMLTGTGSGVTGGTGTYSYQWQQSTDGGTTWTNITGASGPTHNPGILSAGITMFRRIATSGLCTSTSNTVSIDVQTNLSNYNISASQTICEGTAPALLDGQDPTGGTGTYIFQWQVSTDGVNWTVIPGATLPDFQPGTLTVRTYYRRVTSGGNCPAISNVVTININPTANGAITGPAAICQYQSAAVTFTATAGTPTFTVQLLVTAPGGGTTTITELVATNGPIPIAVIAANSVPGTYTIALQSVSDNGGCVRTVGLNTVTITVTATPALTFNPAAPAICAGTPVNITASGATTYTWSPATGLSTTTGATVSANPAATTTYTVTGTTNGCNGTGTVTVTVNPLPAKPVVIRPVAYCQNATAVPLSGTALAGHSLTWYNNPGLTSGTTVTPTPSTATAGTVYYYVTQTNTTTNCVSDTSTIEVTITPAITGNTISATQTVCSGSPAAVLTATAITGGTGAYAYQWQQSTDGGATWTNITGGTSPTYDPGTLATGIFHFRRIVTSGLCSSTSNVVIITVETNLSNYDISANQTVCAGVVPAPLDGQSPTGGTGAYSYVWQSSPNGTVWTTIAGAILEDYSPPALTASTYYRRITSGGNCPATSTAVLITVNPTPDAAITAPTTGICSYDSANVSFTASVGTAPYTIQLLITAPGGGTSTITRTITSNGPVSINVIPTNSAAGTYTVQLVSVTDNNGCSRTTGFSPVSIVVTAKPNVTVNAGATTICEGTSTPLTASGATTYAWSPSTGLSGTTGSSLTANPVVNTTYQVIGTTNGCLDTNTIAITVIARPAKPVARTPVEYCLNATATPLIATATAGNTLTWYNNPGLTGGNATAPTPSTATAGTVYYYVTQTNSNNCVSDTSIITVTVRPLPSVDFDLPAGICMPNGVGTFTNRTTIADNSVLTYAWNFGDGSGVSTATSPTYGYAASGSYIVTLTATSPYGCTASRQKTMSAFFEKPVADFDVNPDALCQGQDNYFTDNSDPMGSTITKWQWFFGDGKTDGTKNPTHRYAAAGNYTVQLIVTTAIGCVSDTFEKDVVVYVQPRIDAGPSFVVPEGTVVQFKATANDTNTVTLVWTPPTGLSNPGILQPTLTVRQNQTYTLTAIGVGNCTAIDTMTVRILKQIEIPNAFSPNGDGTNDRWLIPNLADYPGAKVEVFNRWGQMVFLSYGYNRPWDGTYLGKPLPLATYYYIITLNNGFKPVTGSVTIIK